MEDESGKVEVLWPKGKLNITDNSDDDGNDDDFLQ